MCLPRRSAVEMILGAALTGAAWHVRQAQAGTLAPPTGAPILSVSGKISQTNTGDTAVFDRAMLEALGSASITTRTPWYDNKVTFEGVPLERVLAAVGATGQTLEVLALNDYATEIPVSDMAAYHPLLALKRDGAYMPVRDKGPLFIVYNYDSDPALARQTYYNRSAWQVAKIIVK